MHQADGERAGKLAETPVANALPSPNSKTRSGPDMYPALLKLAGRPCLVVGGGPVALRKAEELLRCGAQVRVISPEWRADFGSFRTDLGLSTRPFQPDDLDGVFVAVAATDDPQVQEAVWREAERRGVLCNVVDVPELCSFFVPATLRRGSLAVSVSTEGKSPLLAVAIRDRLAALLGPDLAPGLERLAEGRRIVRELYPTDPGKRSEALRRLATPEAVDDLIEGRLKAFEEHWESWTSSLPA